jgi:(2Fe-2S) ferredoxin
VTPEHAEQIIQEHVIGGRIVRSLCFAENPLYLVPPEPDKL